MDYFYRRSKHEIPLAVHIIKDEGRYQARVGDRSYTISAVRWVDGVLYLTVDGQQQRLVMARQDRSVWVALAGQTYQLQSADRRSGRGESASGPVAAELEALMPGAVLEILVVEGETVTRGQPILVLEAMKMEQRLLAPGDGVVRTIHVQPGQRVQQGQVLVTFSSALTGDR